MATLFMSRFCAGQITYRPAVIVISALMLTGCFGDEMSDLKSYIASVKARPASKIPPLPTFESYVTVPYEAKQLRPPFTPPQQVQEDLTPPPVANKGGKAPTRPPVNRKLEPLESYSLDALKFVGYLAKNGVRWAAIATPDKLIQHVRIGDHMGQNYGKVVSITETRIEILEIIEDGMGGWSEQPATLSVVE